MFNATREVNYMKTQNYLEILFGLDKSYFSWNGGDKRLTDKDWTKTGDLAIPFHGIYLTDIFALRKDHLCSKLLPAAFYTGKQLNAISTCE